LQWYKCTDTALSKPVHYRPCNTEGQVDVYRKIAQLPLYLTINNHILLINC